MRHETLFPLFRSLSSLPGVGARTERLFADLGILTIRDLIMRPPNRYIDRQLRTHLQGTASGTPLSVRGTVLEHRPPRTTSAPYTVRFQASDTVVELVFFRAGRDWLARLLPIGAVRIISGTLELYAYGHRIVHPDHILTDAEFTQLPQFEPVYSTVSGLTHKFYRKVLCEALKIVPDLAEWNDGDLLAQEGWASWRESVLKLHSPLCAADLEPHAPARRRLAYDEVLAYQFTLSQVRSGLKKKHKPALVPTKYLQKQLLAQLPYTLTSAQERVIKEIIEDIQKPLSMVRLLQGDVGAGKTLVALMCMLAVVEGGGQCALMVPTEVLARQHGCRISQLCEKLRKATQDATQDSVRCVVLTGRDKGRTRARITQSIASGSSDIVIGTHALFQEGVQFHNLCFVVLDEQHRFGVNQRLALIEKGLAPDVLTMTATPIPRTLCLTQYGDMDVSVLDQKPAGRQPIETSVLSVKSIPDIITRLQAAFSRGRQAYWICPLVEDTDKLDLTAAQTRYEALSHALDGVANVGLVHGKQSAQEKEAVLQAFQAGEIDVLVATTVIEVGIDVPNASIIIIEHAERFGLAQLHQLRGRVGRGDDAAACLLLYAPPLGALARERLGILRTTNDGFQIAEKDVQLRGAGDIIGTQQSGLPTFRLLDWQVHADLIERAHVYAKAHPAHSILIQLFSTENTGNFIQSG